MSKLAVLLCLLTSPVFAADPPDWYAHLSSETRAALLASRTATPAHAALASSGILGSRVQGSEQPARYTAVGQFDASALVHPPQHSTLYWLVMQDRDRALLRAYRTPDAEFRRWQRVGKHDQF